MRKHYAKRMPSISYAFGIFRSDDLVGVCTYGGFANINLNEIVKGYGTLELNRLVIDEDEDDNCASVIVSRSLKLLPRPMVVISYADATMGHVGYIYQATNWLYTGQSQDDHEFERDGHVFHRKSIYERLGSSSVAVAEKGGYKKIKIRGKHRYVYFLGSKKEKKIMRSTIEEKWGYEPYPKGKTKRYDSGETIKSGRFNLVLRLKGH
jgi:hypothetical protein